MAIQFAGQFEFISSFGKLLQAHADNGEMHASQDPGNIGTEERWNVYVWETGLVSLSNFSNNLFLSAQPSGEAVANRGQPSIWEQWTLHANGDKTTISLLGYHGKWLTAQAPGNNTQWGGEVAADRDACGAWEHFSMIPSAQLDVRTQNWFNSVTNALQQAAGVAAVVIPLIP